MALHFHFGSSSPGIAYCLLLPSQKTVFCRRDLEEKKNTNIWWSWLFFFCVVFVVVFSSFWGPSKRCHFSGNARANPAHWGQVASARTCCSVGIWSVLGCHGHAEHVCVKDVSCNALGWEFKGDGVSFFFFFLKVTVLYHLMLSVYLIKIHKYL